MEREKRWQEIMERLDEITRTIEESTKRIKETDERYHLEKAQTFASME
jgi:hypothetical protein